ncbi:MAG: HD domain-containing protein [Alphaproteobacteria bacterium]|nr:HD domain-containing protein [Alphaproteobacteria bacterium]
MTIVDELSEIYATKGRETFEGDRRVTQTSHGLQTAMIAEQEGAPAAMIVAALLHDIGRIINPKDREITDGGGDAKHEEVARAFLEPWFGPEVTMPIKWHVAAKRYLVATDPAYAKRISPGSTRSLAGQGGVSSDEEAAAFIAQPYAEEGVTLRRWDDRAKRPDDEIETPPFEHFIPYIEACLKR